jgi:hypothetical protein
MAVSQSIEDTQRSPVGLREKALHGVRYRIEASGMVDAMIEALLGEAASSYLLMP